MIKSILLVIALLIIPVLSAFFDYHFGTALLLSLYLAPFAFYYFGIKLNLKKGGKAKGYFIALKEWAIVEWSNVIIISYFIITGALSSIVGSVYAGTFKAANPFFENMEALVAATDFAGHSLIFLVMPVLICAHFLDKLLQQATGYIRFSGGYFDPVTGENNISLRYKTFSNALESSKDPKSLGLKIGKEYAGGIKNKYTLGTKIGPDVLNAFLEKWNESDAKAGWFEHVGFSGSNPSIKIELTYIHSLANRLKKNHGNAESACDFLEGYTNGVLKGVSANDAVKIELQAANCKKCRDGEDTFSQCIFDVNFNA